MLASCGAQPMLLPRFAAGRKRAARTLSRDFWQQKNFYANRLRVSSALAKTGFLSESPPLIRKGKRSVSHRAAARLAAYGKRSMHMRSRRAAAKPPHRLTRGSEAELGFEQIVDGLRIGLAAG
jgi:hypothetical protein